MGTRLYNGQPWKMDKTSTYIRRPSPDLGQDNEHVLGKILGVGEAEIAALYELGALGKEPDPMPKRPAQMTLEETRKRFADEIDRGSLAGYDPDYKKALEIR